MGFFLEDLLILVAGGVVAEDEGFSSSCFSNFSCFEGGGVLGFLGQGMIVFQEGTLVIEYLHPLDKGHNLRQVGRITTEGITLWGSRGEAQYLIGDTLPSIQEDISAILDILIVADVNTVLLHRIHIQFAFFVLFPEQKAIGIDTVVKGNGRYRELVVLENHLTILALQFVEVEREDHMCPTDFQQQQHGILGTLRGMDV